MKTHRAFAAACVLLLGSLACSDTSGPDEELPPALFTEEFETTLAQWSGRPSGHHGEIFPDPLRSGNKTIRFTRPVAAGDLFSNGVTVEPNRSYVLTFEYLGLSAAGSPVPSKGL